MKNVKLSIRDFEKKYYENYTWLYDGGDELSEYNTLWQEFEDLCARNEDFVSFVNEFCEFIGDYILSDREEAAFILTFHDMTDGEIIAWEEIA